MKSAPEVRTIVGPRRRRPPGRHIRGPWRKRPGGHPERAAGIKRKSHGRRWNLCECGRRACRRIVAIDAIVRIDGDENGAMGVDRQVLEERSRLPRRDRNRFDRSKLSPIVIRIIVFSRRDHFHRSLTV